MIIMGAATKPLAFGLLLTTLIIFGCHRNYHGNIQGTWESEKGENLIFQDSENALWVVNFTDKVDTVKLKYRLNFDHHPAQIDFYDFDIPQLKGQSLYGIVQVNDSSFRCDSKPGFTQEVRPKRFSKNRTQVFYRR